MLSLFHGELKPGWLVGRILKATKGASYQETHDISRMMDQLAPCMDEWAEDGRHLTVVIDNAHKISTAEAMEEIHALIDLQSVVAPA